MRGRWVLTFVTAFVWLGCGEKSVEKGAGAEENKAAAEATANPEKPGADEKVEEEAEKAEEKSAVVVYSGRGEVLVGPLFEAFTEKTGYPVEVRYEKSSEGLANRIATEGEKTSVDVFFAQDSGYLGALGKKKFLQVLPETLTNQVEESYRPGDNTWLPTSGRARVLVYSPERVKTEDLPKTLS